MADYLLSESELCIMKVIWNSETAISMQQILEIVNDRYQKNWKPQTVSVFLGRMVNKKMLKSERKGRVFYYTPTMTKNEYVKKESKRWVDALADGKADVFLRHLLNARNLSADEITGLKELLG